MSVGRSRLRPAPEGHPAPRSPASNCGRFTPPEAGLSRLVAHCHCSAEPFYELAQMSVCTKRLTLSVGRKGHLPPPPAPPGSVREGRGCQAGSRPRDFRHRPKSRAPVNHQRRHLSRQFLAARAQRYVAVVGVRNTANGGQGVPGPGSPGTAAHQERHRPWPSTSPARTPACSHLPDAPELRPSRQEGAGPYVASVRGWGRRVFWRRGAGARAARGQGRARAAPPGGGRVSAALAP